MDFKRLFMLAIICLTGSFIFSNFLIEPGTQPEATVQAAVDLINIDDLSNDYMSDYFTEVAQNIGTNQPGLIVTSATYPADTFGATNVIAAPNNQYFLYYESDSAKEVAATALSDASLAVEDDIVLEITDATYNSWGITDMGLDLAAEFFADKNAPEITVAIIDTGLDLDLFESNFSAERVAGTYNLYDQYMHDSEGHGTHIAGTIAEGTPENVKIFPLKTSDNRSMRMSAIITAINYVNYYRRADVINMSFRVSGSSTLALFAAIQAAANNGIISVAAAGNDNDDADTFYPAAYSNTISVAAVDTNHTKAAFSNYGSTVTFTAPGTQIKSINKTSSGTSMAAPHVAAAVAILKSANSAIDTSEAIEILKAHAIDLGEEGHDIYYGYGFIDLSDFASFADSLKDTVTSNFAITDTTQINPIFGNITNLMNIPVNIISEDESITSLTLGDLEDLTITDYDAFAPGEQEITISWQGFTQKITVDNGINGGDTTAYQTWDISNNEIGIISVSGGNETLPHRLYLPTEINGKTLTTVGSSSNQTGIFSGNNTGATHIILPSTVNAIGDRAFTNDSMILSIEGGSTNGVTVGNYAFYLTEQLVEFSPVVKNLGTAAFAGATSLRAVVLSDDIIALPNNAFESCYNLTELNIPKNLTSIGAYALYKTRLSSIRLPKTLEGIGAQAFYGMPALESIYIDPENAIYTSDGDSANAIIEKTTNTLLVGSGSTVIPDYVVKIADNAFYGNQTLIALATNQVTSLGVNIFNDCTNFEVLYIENIDLLTTNSLSGRFNNTIPDLTIYTPIMPADTSFIDTIKSSEGIKAFIVITPNNVMVSADTEYLAFERVKNLSISVEYEGFAFVPHTLTEVITDYEITYEHGEAFTAGDTSFTVTATTQYGYTFEFDVEVVVRDCFDDTLSVKDHQITTAFGDTFSSIIGHISFDTDSISHYDSAGNSAESDDLKTGDKLRIAIDPDRTVEYDIAVRGDVDGDGRIGIIDYIRVRKDIMSLNKLSGIYREAADMNDNQLIDIIDYIRIKKIIMEAE